MAPRARLAIYAGGRGSPTRVPFFCFIHRTTGGVPHFEVLPEEHPDHAVRRCARLLAERHDAERAELWQGETLVRVLRRDEPVPTPVV